MTIASLPGQHAASPGPEMSGWSERDLLAAIRAGSMDAFGELWVRHQRVALAVARRSSSSDPDDLVAEAFARILRLLRSNKGPTDQFRAYLCATIKSCATDEYRRRHGTVSVGDDLEVIAKPRTEDFPSDRPDDACRAWEGLDEQQQWLLWANAVEGYSLTEIADRLGAKPATVAVWLFRARERLRVAFLDGYVASSDNAICQEHRQRFAAYLRGSLSPRRRAATEAHVEECADCAQALASVGGINQKLRAVIWPLLPLEATRLLAAMHGGTHLHRVPWHHGIVRAASAKGAAAAVAAASVAAVGVTTIAIVVPDGGTHRSPHALSVIGPTSTGSPRGRVATVPAEPSAVPSDRIAGRPVHRPTSASTQSLVLVDSTPIAKPTGAANAASSGPASAAPASAAPASAAPASAPLGPAAPPTSSAPAASGPLMANPGFESGSAGWTSSSPASVFWNDGGYAHSGTGYAWIDGQPVADTETLSQTVSIPSGTRATLTYWLMIATAHTNSTPVDTLALTANGTTVQSYSNANAGGYAQRTVDLSTFAGKTVTLTWTGVQATSTGTSFFIDDVAVSLG